MPFEFIRLKIPDVILIKPKKFEDSRGFFLETFKESDFEKNGIIEKFVQDNHSLSSKNVLRGLHYQMPPFAQGKLIKCIKGEIFDIALDIRKSSKTFSQWIGVYLSSKNCNMLYIPPGFAHGFYTMQNNNEVIYKSTAEYSPECDRGIFWGDPKIGIKLQTNEVQLSEKDKALPDFDKAELFP